MTARVLNMLNLITWPLRSEIWLFVPFSLLSLIAILMESELDMHEYNESEDGAFQNISTLSDGSLVEILPKILEFKFFFFFAIMALCGVLYTVTKVLQYIFFGKLTEAERTDLSQFFFRFIILRIVILSSVINITRFVSVYAWIAWFSVLGLLHGCSIVAVSRCNQLIITSTVSQSEWIRSMGSVVLLTVGNFVLFKAGLIGCLVLSDYQTLVKLRTVSQQGVISAFRSTTLGVLKAKLTGRKDFVYDTLGVEVIIAAECFLLFLSIMHFFGKLIIELYDRRMVKLGQSWTRHASFAFYVDLIYRLSSRIIVVTHYTHLLLWSRLFSVASLIIFLHIRFAFASLVHHVNRYIDYLRRMNYIKDNFEAFSVTTTESKATSIDKSALKKRAGDQGPTDSQPDKPTVETCAICWEEMHVWRRLRCKHDFHETCLCSWMEQHPTCPTCRRPLGLPPPTAATMEANRNAENGQLVHFHDLLLQTIARHTEAASSQEPQMQRVDRLVHQGPSNTQHLASRLWNRVFGSRGSVGSSTTNTSSSSSTSSQQEPLEEQVGSPPVSANGTGEDQSRRDQPVNRRQFDGNYLPWLNSELSEMLRQMLTVNQISSEDEVAPSQDEFTDDSPSSSTNHELIYLHQRLRAPALEISSILPQFPLSVIVADLLQTGVPDRTVENLLSRPAPSSSTLTQQSTDADQPEGPADSTLDQLLLLPQQHRPGSQTDDNDSEGGAARPNRLLRMLVRARRRFFASGSSTSRSD